jgi:TonB family protein
MSAPRPKYPLEARKHHWVGVGWFLMRVDEPTGAVTSVEILQSTGHKILDRAAVDALKAMEDRSSFRVKEG